MLVGMECGRVAGGHNAPKKLLNGLASREGIRPPMLPLEQGSFQLLRGSHRTTASELRVIEPIDVVGGPDQEVQVERPVLAVLESPEAVQHQRLARCRPGSQTFVDEQAVTTESLAQPLKGAVGDIQLTGDLAKGGAGEQAVEKRLEEVSSTEPVGGGECL
jgi:hypothetical protein